MHAAWAASEFGGITILRASAHRHNHGWVGACCWNNHLHAAA